jgi:hypothetical protein
MSTFAFATTNENKASSFQALAINEENFSTGYLRIKLTVETATTRPLFHVKIKVRQFLFKNLQRL